MRSNNNLFYKACVFIIFTIATGFQTYEEISFKYDHSQTHTKGLFPNVFNLAASSIITVNATCGETGSETYCKLVEHVFLREDLRHIGEPYKPQCSVCDVTSSDKQHPISNAIDGTNKYWQSPTLQNGKHFQWVTITLDLGQIYQVAYIIVKSAISPRPGNWILERSVDGIVYKPWQYFAVSDTECWESYGISPTVGKPHYRTDNEVICTSYYSKLNPLENGEIHTSLVNGRPGADEPSMKLREFTKARYVRLRLQKIRTLNADLMSLQTDDPDRTDNTVTRRYFYSIRDISVGGQCSCSGHAKECFYDQSSGKQNCKCEHNTCGTSCEKCCPLFNQKAFEAGTSIDASPCLKCECFGHSESCHFDQLIATKGLSLNSLGYYDGGGVCDSCKHHTTGINCEQCEDGYFRPSHVPRNHTKPCKKCQCTGPGVTGICVKDDSHIIEGAQPGECLCKVGFEGKKCDRCANGYRNYPVCEPCPCHSAGTLGSNTCEGQCVCKPHVEGSRCDRCKRGFYHLSAENPDGCSACFCFGLTDECVESDWGVEIIQKLEEWRVTDLKGKKIVRPILEKRDVVIANDDISQLSNYYWLAPPDYLGKKLYSYGADLRFSVSYVVARGDTSGTYTESADVILEGNGVQLGHNWSVRPELDYVTITMPLREQGWFLMDSSGKSHTTVPVNREMFTLALNNLTRLLIRAKFHTDQIEGRLHDIGLEIASQPSKSLKKLTSVEQCVCPPGHAGLSCELCASGYRQIKTGSSLGFYCEQCDCHNHAECDADSGYCLNCTHHTVGLKCQHCKPGYYGDAKIGTESDCKRCACPLEQPENNFSPTCIATEAPTGESDYFCDNCPVGYQGNKCERCSHGYFGNPQIPSGFCQPCDCSNNADTSQPDWCDALTGQCLKCLGNTGGWNCAECLPAHYGDPERRSCRACLCNTYGSVSPECDQSTGDCICKDHFFGKMCDRCAEGYGNIEAGCVPCKCSALGSRSQTCDPVTGACQCKPGVFGVTCDFCLENHYGFSHHGCRECNCDAHGAISHQCNEVTGSCVCKNNVVGQRCELCQDGYWNLASPTGCEVCHCNRTGSVAELCDKNTGRCTCKPGVGGNYCDQCLPGYYKFNPRGCRKCDPCDIPGHICDPTNGRCVCPALTVGRHCENCETNAWGYDAVSGCKPCNCDPKGSPNQRCDPNTGHCVCLAGFKGRHCDQCRYGFYNFPNCHSCDCHLSGTELEHCQIKDGICQCQDDGQCVCKKHIAGKKCDKCEEDAFGLSAENKNGCHKCFCFGHGNVCNQANMYWSKISFPSQEVFTEIGTSEIPTILGYQVIPHDSLNRRLGIPYVLDKPLYYSLPKEQLGDKVLSYNGVLRFYVESHSGSHFPEALLSRHPLVVLQGNHRIILGHSPVASRRPYEIRIHENEWINLDNPKSPVTRLMLMVALQNLQTLLIRATDGPDVKYSRLHNVSIDIASTEYQTGVLTDGVELCRCPRQYTGTSCQDPAPGYYRKRKPNYLDSKELLDLVGWAEPCSCNNHTTQCDSETGVCINCQGNTMGNECHKCKKGFYGDPTHGPCRPCSCPHPKNSFSDTCLPDAIDYVCVNCQVGYTGRHCEKCEKGYYGDPKRDGGRCIECMCNPYGSNSRHCDPISGQCQCKEGISGQNCTICSHGFILTEYGCKSCEDECTGVLLRELYDMKLELDSLNVSALPKLPWAYLKKMNDAESQWRPLVDDYQAKVSEGKELINNFTFYFDLESKADGLLVRAMEFGERSFLIAGKAKDTLDEAEKLFLELNKIWRHIKDLASELEQHGRELTGPGLSTERMLLAAERILDELKMRNFQKDKETADRELRKAQGLLTKINEITRDRGHIDALQQRLDVLNHLLQELVKKINEDVQKPTDRALQTVKAGRLRYNEIQETLGRIAGILDTCNITLQEAADILGLARGFIIDAAVKFEYLPRLLNELKNATELLDKHRGILSSLNPIYKEKYVIPAQEHAEALERQSKRLTDLFAATKELSEFPLQAVNAYQNIVEAIIAAENAAGEAARAADRAYIEAYPAADDALTSQAEKARLRSMRLLAEAQRLNEESVPELEIALQERDKELVKLSEDTTYGKRKNDIINRELDALPTGAGRELQEANQKSGHANNKARAANAKIDDIDSRINDDLKPRFDAILGGTVKGLENLTKIIQRAREDIRGATQLADNAAASEIRVRRHNAQLQLNLKDLKDKILLARQKASSIRVALTTDRRKQCFRSYKADIEPTTTNAIVLNYAIETGATDSLLFFVGSAHEEDFMAVEMYNRKIRFLWNAGGGTQTIQHNMTIETNSNQLLSNDKWFKIEVNRIGNIASLSVKRTPEGHKPDPYEVSGASPAGYAKMNFDSSSHLFVGGFPDNYLPPSELRSSSFAGCLYSLEFDGKNIGLWNFLSNVGCDGCKEGATEEIDISAYEFQGGNSYAVVPQNPYYRKSDIYTVLNFKTLNEDALLFLSSNSKSGDLMSLELKKGKVVYRLKFGETRIHLETRKKYNNGQWIRVEAAREKHEAQILVEDELLEETGTKYGSSALDLKDSSLYFGGVPPNFTKERWPEIEFKSFFGCLKDLQMDSTPIALSRGSFYAMSVGCSDKALKVCSFNGAGYVEMHSKPLTADSSFSFSFFTHQKNALLLLSTFVGKSNNPDELQNYFSVSLSNGHINIRMSSDAGEIGMPTDHPLSGGQYHTITVVRKNRRLLLQIDDIEEADIKLPRGAKDIFAPSSGGLFFGGVKEGMTIHTMTASQHPFVGIIQDVIFNDRLMRFDEAVSYQGVDFGFADTSLISDEFLQQIAVSPSHSGDNCLSVDNSVDATAFSPSGSRHGFQTIEIHKKDVHKSFNLTFEFRTHLDDGILLFAKNDIKRQEFILFLLNNTLVLQMKKKGLIKSVHSHVLDKGFWHRVEILKSQNTQRGKVLLHVNSKTYAINEHFKSLAHLFKTPLYVGGAPKKLSDSEIESFYGCMRNFHINNAVKRLSSAFPCFKQSEPGNYFNGDSYVIYDSAYYLSHVFEVELQFRTSRTNGNLLYLYSSDAQVVFRLEIFDSEVIGTFYSQQDQQRIQLSRSLKTKFENCDSHVWHSVRFSYKHGTLSLQLDDLKPVDKTLEKQLNLNYVEVFIGGNPKKHRNESSNNYEGCMKNIVINNEQLDLRNAEDSQIIHHSCPLN